MRHRLSHQERSAPRGPRRRTAAFLDSLASRVPLGGQALVRRVQTAPDAGEAWHLVRALAAVRPMVAAPKTAPRFRRVWRAWLRLRHQRFGRRYRRLVLERIYGVSLVVLPDVFNPVLLRSGAFLARSVPSPPLPAGSAPAARVPPARGTGSATGATSRRRGACAAAGAATTPAPAPGARTTALLTTRAGGVG